MADSKISALTGATTPLSGTEVLPVVQSGSTVKVAVSDLTAGRDVTMTSVTVGNARTRFASSYIADVPGPTGNNTGILFGGNTIFPCDGNGSLTNGVVSLGTSSYKWYDIFLENNVNPAAAKGINFTANTPAAGMTSQLLNWYEEGTWTPVDSSGAGLTLTVTAASYTRIGRMVYADLTITYPTTVDGSTLIIGGLPFISKNFGTVAIAYTNETTCVRGSTNPSDETYFVLYEATGAALTNAAMSGDTLRATVIYRTA